ncbi:hypothetical protein [Actinomadura fibrosa]|uniref:Uncharacterized protein n=1 Tax=Actinomadura fibrosa TaxID=111802 RepID=A0ABW2XHA9_9ACTN|nr:hypothetical protein [Actinomadura fibrosa]
MIVRPTENWRQHGHLPDSFLRRVDQALHAFESELGTLDAGSDQAAPSSTWSSH